MCLNKMKPLRNILKANVRYGKTPTYTFLDIIEEDILGYTNKVYNGRFNQEKNNANYNIYSGKKV